jgi:HdeA/HdeB family
MMRTATMIAAAFAIVACIVANPTGSRAASSAPSPQPSVKYYRSYDLTKLKCNDLLQANILDRSSAIMFVWGYEAGRKNVTTFDTDLLEKATHGLMEECEAQPSLSLMTAVNNVERRYAR